LRVGGNRRRVRGEAAEAEEEEEEEGLRRARRRRSNTNARRSRTIRVWRRRQRRRLPPRTMPPPMMPRPTPSRSITSRTDRSRILNRNRQRNRNRNSQRSSISRCRRLLIRWETLRHSSSARTLLSCSRLPLISPTDSKQVTRSGFVYLSNSTRCLVRSESTDREGLMSLSSYST
jgi:hypothetical protein